MKTYKTKVLGLSQDANRMLDIIGNTKVDLLYFDRLAVLADEVEINPDNLQSILNNLERRGLIDVNKGVIELK